MKILSKRLKKIEEHTPQKKEAPITIIREIVERADVIDENTIWHNGIPLKVVDVFDKKSNY